ncbi:50S ribosomal protein L11 methyltransferase [Caldichromatium japonicum]|uniref:Ribosomal protein L11 methyltransferase n=1 Tax=Caldichromatium japonicum TaxID=2699430 RepID=A0A6G7VG56_9GAMM|nr:50S ribosomal protein L11 methyltransferase [Caldichromatium japonicum]QIK38828.1 50S ribosomal protein L11 methyltransferase [Caldichromatium japonicum]
MPWLQLILTAPRHQAKALDEALTAAGALAVTLSDAGDEPQLEPAPGATPLWSEVRLTALFADDPASASQMNQLAQDLAEGLGVEPVIGRLEDQVWERVWLKDFKPTRFGERLWVCPREQAVERPGSAVVALDPGLAFGTGHHATTALCLEWLDGADLDGKTVLDVGCGSGILAIAALKLGAVRAIAVDHDPQALSATHDNAAVNGVLDRLTILSPEALAEPRVEVLVANILAGTLIALAPRLCSLLLPGGALALSGILAEQINQVEAAYRPWIAWERPRLREGWALLSGRRLGDSAP